MGVKRDKNAPNAGALGRYNQKRDFGKTPEPPGKIAPRNQHRFVIQKHAARRLHYDFRLEHGGVLWSWAVPKGPNVDPKVKRLAMRTEDHPVSYARFEGIIPRGEYGGGTVLLWDEGTWSMQGDPDAAMKKGHIRFRLDGHKLGGEWVLLRTHRGEIGKESWLLRKLEDDAAKAGGDIAEERPESVASGRVLEEIAKSPDRVWHSKSSGQTSGGARPKPARLQGAKKAPLPQRIEPQLATLVEETPGGNAWIHELKLDGYRILARVDGDRVKLQTRGGKDWSEAMPSLCRALASLELGKAVLDGEAVVYNKQGITEFQLMQNALSNGKDAAIHYAVFDLLYLDGYDLTGLPLLERKRLLKELLTSVAAVDGRVRFNDHIEGQGDEFFARACELHTEGVVSKRAGDPYRSGRSRSWLKIKCGARQEVVVVGWTEPSGSRAHFGALLIGLHRDGKLHFAGKVGTGYNATSLKELKRRLAPLEIDEPAVIDPPTGAKARGMHWVKPTLVAEVAMTEITRDGKIRHPVFQGLRDDKPAVEVQPEKPLDPILSKVRLTNPDRVLYPDVKVTKRDLALYYARVADWILPHISRRPLTLVRCPEGHTKQSFYQKHAIVSTPKTFKRIPIKDSNGLSQYLYIDDLEGLMAVPQMSVLELHPWGSFIDNVEKPNMLIFDLDPAPELPWAAVVEGALDLRRRLKELDLQTFVKTTGGKGLHIVLPIARRYDWDAAKAWTKSIANAMVRDQPKRYVAVTTKAKRTGKIFIDYLRNGRGATAIAAYSTRARPGALVATPLSWDELEAGVEPTDFDVRTVPDRLGGLAVDPWADFFKLKQLIKQPD